MNIINFILFFFLWNIRYSDKDEAWYIVNEIGQRKRVFISLVYKRQKIQIKEENKERWKRVEKCRLKIDSRYFNLVTVNVILFPAGFSHNSVFHRSLIFTRVGLMYINPTQINFIPVRFRSLLYFTYERLRKNGILSVGH